MQGPSPRTYVEASSSSSLERERERESHSEGRRPRHVIEQRWASERGGSNDGGLRGTPQRRRASARGGGWRTGDVAQRLSSLVNVAASAAEEAVSRGWRTCRPFHDREESMLRRGCSRGNKMPHSVGCRDGVCSAARSWDPKPRAPGGLAIGSRCVRAPRPAGERGRR